MNVQPFIFNWPGRYKNTKILLSQLKQVFGGVTVVNSDENNRPKKWINLTDQHYFSGQFNAALQNFTGDVLFHVQGDVKYNNWKQLVDDAVFYMERYSCGIYAPNIDFTVWKTDCCKITDHHNMLSHDNLDIVSCTDETVWFIHKDIINKLKEYQIEFLDHEFGWGVDMTMAAICFLNNRLVIRDDAHVIYHPEGTGYNWDGAQEQLEQYRERLPQPVAECIKLIEDKQHDKLYQHFTNHNK